MNNNLNNPSFFDESTKVVFKLTTSNLIFIKGNSEFYLMYALKIHYVKDTPFYGYTFLVY